MNRYNITAHKESGKRTPMRCREAKEEKKKERMTERKESYNDDDDQERRKKEQNRTAKCNFRFIFLTRSRARALARLSFIRLRAILHAAQTILFMCALSERKRAKQPNIDIQNIN